MRSKCATFLEQSFALPKPSPSHSSGPEWSTYLQVAPKGAKTAGKCKWYFSCSMVGCRLKSVRRRRDSGLARGACGRFLEVSFFSPSTFIAECASQRREHRQFSLPALPSKTEKKNCGCVPRFQGWGAPPLVAFSSTFCSGCIEGKKLSNTLFAFSSHLLHILHVRCWTLSFAFDAHT